MTTVLSRNDLKFYESLILAQYNCDFGNIVRNSCKKKHFMITNNTNRAIEMQFDQKKCKVNGFAIIGADKFPKFQPNESHQITIMFTAKKTSPCGKIRCDLPVKIKQGTEYNIQLSANVTIPEISIEPNENVDFSKVLIGQRKTMYIRFFNEKEVPCEWYLN